MAGIFVPGAGWVIGVNTAGLGFAPDHYSPITLIGSLGTTPAAVYTTFHVPQLNLWANIVTLVTIHAPQPPVVLAMGGGLASIHGFHFATDMGDLGHLDRMRMLATTFQLMQTVHHYPMNARIQFRFEYYIQAPDPAVAGAPVYCKQMWGSTPMLDLADVFTPAGAALFQTTFLNAIQSAHHMTIIKWNWHVIHPDPGGGGRNGLPKGLPIKDVRLHRDKNRILIPDYGDDDHTCAQRALVTLWKYHEYTNTPTSDRTPLQIKQYKLLRERRGAKRKTSATGRYVMSLVDELTRVSGIPTTRDTDFKDMDKFATALTQLTGKKCCIRIYKVSQGMELAYCSLPMDSLPPDIDDYLMFNLCLDNGHYTAVTKLHKLMYNARKECRRCNVFYSNTHKCKASVEMKADCTLCFKQGENHYYDWKETKDRSHWKTCDDCHRSFYGEECFLYHQTPRPDGRASACKTKWKCTSCSCIFFYPSTDGKACARPKQTITPEDHNCGDQWCLNCKGFTAENHQCYIQPITLQPKDSGKYIFADFECTQDHKDNKYHRVNLAVSISHTGRQWVHSSISEWVDFMLTPEFDGFIFIFHYGKGYDFQFILEYLTQHSHYKLNINPIFVGGKVLSFTVSRQRSRKNKTVRIFKCSHNIIPMALSQFTKTFGLTAKKGFCPHKFNTDENYNYIGPLPPKEDFLYEYMTPDKAAEFHEWYDERQRAGNWDQAKELLEYCIDDVKLLKDGCMAFNEIVLGITDGLIEPFRDCITIASLTQLMYRAMFLELETLPALHAEDVARMRKGFKGGRTGGCYCYYDALADPDTDIKIHYDDVTSMYPFVNSQRPYPVGFPVFFNFEEDHKISYDSVLDIDLLGIWCVDIDCPADLFHPLLPSNRQGLLMFDLTPKRREVYATPELTKALALGYTIKQVHWAYQWAESSKELFKSYIDTFLKIKQESSGWPRSGMTEEEKQEYIEYYMSEQGVQLDYKKIEKNPGLRSVAKLALNSFWGKFGQRVNSEYTSTDILFDTPDGRRKFNKLMTDPKRVMSFMIFENALMLKSKGSAEKPYQAIANTCIPVAVFTTCWARLHLYEQLERLGEQVIYYDTDSIIYMTGGDFKEDIIPKGSLLGEWTSELSDGEYITQVAVGGPKNYAYLTNISDKQVVKVKGHSLHSISASHFSFETVKRAVLNQQSIGMTLPQIVRGSDLRVRTVEQTKMYQFRFDKRKMLPTTFYDPITKTLPYYIKTIPWTNADEANDYRLHTLSTIASLHSDVDDKTREMILRTVKQAKLRKRRREANFHWVRVFHIIPDGKQPGYYKPYISVMDEPDYMLFAIKKPKAELIAHVEGFPSELDATDQRLDDANMFPCTLAELNIYFNQFLEDIHQVTAHMDFLRIFVHMNHLNKMEVEARKSFLAAIPGSLRGVHVL